MGHHPLVLLVSALAVVSCATAVDRASAPRRVEQPLPLPSLGKDAGRALRIPVKGVPAAALVDTYAAKRGRRIHEALDIMAPRGTPVLAADDGSIARIRRHPLGGRTIHQYDRDRAFVFYYAHLEGYAPGLREGAEVRRGDVLGYVGTSGNASPTAPHLHFAMMRLRDGKSWRGAESLNPLPLLTDEGP